MFATVYQAGFFLLSSRFEVWGTIPPPSPFTLPPSFGTIPPSTQTKDLVSLNAALIRLRDIISNTLKSAQLVCVETSYVLPPYFGWIFVVGVTSRVQACNTLVQGIISANGEGGRGKRIKLWTAEDSIRERDVSLRQQVVLVFINNQALGSVH